MRKRMVEEMFHAWQMLTSALHADTFVSLFAYCFAGRFLEATCFYLPLIVRSPTHDDTFTPLLFLFCLPVAPTVVQAPFYKVGKIVFLNISIRPIIRLLTSLPLHLGKVLQRKHHKVIRLKVKMRDIMR